MSQWVVVILPCVAVILQVLVYKEIIAVRYHAVKERNLTLFRTLNWYFLGITLFYFYATPSFRFLHEIEAVSGDLYRTFDHFHLWVSFVMYISAFCWFIMSLKPGMYKYQFTQLAWTAVRSPGIDRTYSDVL
jgi:phosphatidate cytidylyltransferase